jgi:hypothetical protein
MQKIRSKRKSFYKEVSEIIYVRQGFKCKSLRKILMITKAI